MQHTERMELFNSHMRLAYDVVNKHWVSKYVEYDDLVQEALIALWEATETYDTTTTTKFSTYAHSCIYFKLYNYYYLSRYGQIGCNSNFQLAATYVREALNANKDLKEYLKEKKAPESVRIYAELLSNGDTAFTSLSSVIYTNHEGSDITLEETLSSDCNVEDIVLNAMEEEDFQSFLRDEFVPYCLSRTTVAKKKRQEKLLYYFLLNLEEKKYSQSYIADAVGISRNGVSLQFQRWREYLKKMLLRRCVQHDAY